MAVKRYKIPVEVVVYAESYTEARLQLLQELNRRMPHILPHGHSVVNPKEDNYTFDYGKSVVF